MERTSLTAKKRDLGKGPSRRLRMEGMVPGVLYGKEQEPQPLTVEACALEKALRTGAGLNILIDLKLEDGETVVSRCKDLQTDAIRADLIHVDFQAIDLKEKMVVEVPLHFEGKAPGIKEGGGILQVSRRNLEVRCLPTAIPEHITVDISGLDIGDIIHADDLALPEGVEFPHAENFSIVQVAAPVAEEEVAPAEEEAVEAGEVPTEGEVEAAEDEAKEEKQE